MAQAHAFNPLAWPIIFTEPLRATHSSAWLTHIPFAFFLIDALRPRTFVELGTHYGDSYSAFCQAIAATGAPTRAFAVDTWQGDSHTHEYGSEVLESLRRHHDPLYLGFSTLMRTTFDEASGKFDDGSIDLLHIDGLHTYDAVKHDFETWIPKMSPRGVVLFHDTAVHDHGFGVFRLMDELRGKYPLFEFQHGKGLGVLCAGRERPQGFDDFFTYAQSSPDIARLLFERLGERIRFAAYTHAYESGLRNPVKRAGRYLRRVAMRLGSRFRRT